jgi:hypothetical protein
MLLRSLVVVGLVGLSIVYSVATAEDAGTLNSNSYAVEGVSFSDIGNSEGRPTFALNVVPTTPERFPNAQFASDGAPANHADPHHMEVALTGTRIAGSALDLEFSQRASVGFNSGGDLERRSQGREVRLGRRLGNRLQNALGIGEWTGGRANWDNPTWYFFASSDDTTISFRDGRVRTQDEVDVGDVQVGITMERGPLQASIAYIERETNLQTWRKNYKFDQAFTGVSVRWRH